MAIVTLKQLCDELGVDGRYARIQLRKMIPAEQREKGHRYSWDDSDPQFKEINDFLVKAAAEGKGKPREPKAKKDKAEGETQTKTADIEQFPGQDAEAQEGGKKVVKKKA